MTTQFKVICPDGRSIFASKYEPTCSEAKGLIIINSALGIKREFYQPLATYLSKKGFAIITWDPRGVGASALANVKSDPARLRDWGAIDLESVLNYVVDAGWSCWDKLTVLGHSAGGHLIGLSQSIRKIRNVILVSSGTCHWRLYAPSQRPKMLLFWYVIVPLVSKLLGYIPGKLGIGHDLPKGVVQDWRDWCIQREYLFSDETLGETYYCSYKGDIKAIGFSDDVAFSPPSTIEDLLTRFTQATTRCNIYHPHVLEKEKVGHFGFFNKCDESVWERVILPQLTG